MGKKIMYLTGIWICVVAAYLVMAASWGAVTDIVDVSVAGMNASGNLSAMPGIEAGVSGFPTYAWAIPAGVGLIASVVILKKD